jgi:hypothetical protein
MKRGIGQFICFFIIFTVSSVFGQVTGKVVKIADGVGTGSSKKKSDFGHNPILFPLGGVPKEKNKNG